MATKQQALTTMPAVDEEGFLVDPKIWTKDVARVLAQGELPGDLMEDHWEVINYLRDYYQQTETVPPVRMLECDTGFSLKYVQKLFPSGLTRGACKIAGIPRWTIKPSFLYP